LHPGGARIWGGYQLFSITSLSNAAAQSDMFSVMYFFSKTSRARPFSIKASRAFCAPAAQGRGFKNKLRYGLEPQHKGKIIRQNSLDEMDKDDDNTAVAYDETLDRLIDVGCNLGHRYWLISQVSKSVCEVAYPAIPYLPY